MCRNTSRDDNDTASMYMLSETDSYYIPQAMAMNGKIAFKRSSESGGHRLQAPVERRAWFARELRLITGAWNALSFLRVRQLLPNVGGTAELCFRPILWGGSLFFYLGDCKMRQQMQNLREASIKAIIDCGSSEELEGLRVKYLGKKGELTGILRQMGQLSAEERPVMGQLANQLRADIETAIEKRKAELSAELLEKKLQDEAIDVTMPAIKQKLGHKHPMYNVLDQIKDIFIGMGFEIIDGPEVEFADYNFTKLNIEEGHPSREWTDTFYFTEDSKILLRTQTSPMQIHAMENRELPIRILAPGRVYRKDEVDATHSPMFHQIEGMVIDKGVTMSDLKATLNLVVEKIYGKGTVTRFRPHHFPFTEPSCEMDIQCHKCGGKGCPTCKGEGWIEVLGAGMVHPKVLAGCGIDPDVYSGWAFGMGLERLAMGEYKITDLRLIFENDVRFLEQF